jgi:molybdenum cofactor synthesis domain-containing protein
MNENLKVFTVGIITSSDKGSAGQREDLSGKVIRELCEPYGGTVTSYKILPDEREQLAGEMRLMADSLKVDVIFTTGGTGLSPRDVTPEATLDVAERMVPGIPEAMRARSLLITDRAMLTRGVACIRKRTLIINLPGSPKAVKECLEVILPVLGHALEVLKNQVQNCAR